MTLTEFYTLIQQLTGFRKKLVQQYIHHSVISNNNIETLIHFRDTFQNIPSINGNYFVTCFNDFKKTISIECEISSIEDDIVFFTGGFDAWIEHISLRNQDIKEQSEACCNFLKQCEQITHFISDRDGTINKTCKRYWSSAQSAVHAILLLEFFKTIRHKLIVSSAPLRNIGIYDLSIIPLSDCILSGSNGLHCLDKNENFIQPNIYPEWIACYEQLTQHLRILFNESQYNELRFIGTGFQDWFLFTGIAFQDADLCVPEKISRPFYRALKATIFSTDPHHKMLQYTADTRSMYIYPRIRNMINLNKHYGLRFLDEQLNLNLSEGIPLICGDSKNDVDMLRYAMHVNYNTHAIFVTTDSRVKQLVSSVCPHYHIVTSPDALLAGLYLWSKQKITN